MGDDDETLLHETYDCHCDMDEEFCARMYMAIAEGLESARIGVVTAPGTKKPKNFPVEPSPLASSQDAMENA